ncbi:MAG TPA: hypothetical protein VI796_05330 [Candidatus Thermoplasmatota archaeon]|nr:hypothetical protein [Candidatus Thermoplasmatota archaeon]
MSVRRGFLLTLALLLAAAAPSDAALTVTAEGPPSPVFLDGNSTVVVHLELDCVEAMAIARPDPIPTGSVVLQVAAPNLTLEGPAEVPVQPGSCLAPDRWAADVAFTIRGDLFVPGLVPILGNLTATVESDTGLPDIASAAATFNVTPEAIVALDLEPAAALPSAVSTAGLDVPLTVTSRSNVDIRLDWRASGAASERIRDGATQEIALPRGAITDFPASTPVARHTRAAPSTATVTLHYVPPTTGTGRDRFDLSASPVVVLEPGFFLEDLDTILTLAYENPENPDEPDRVGYDAEGDHVDSEATPALPPGFAALALALIALRRR